MPESREKRTEQNQSIDRKKWHPRWIGFAFMAVWLAAMAMTLPASADMEPGEGVGEQPQRYLFIRPHAGVGWASAYNRSGNALQWSKAVVAHPHNYEPSRRYVCRAGGKVGFAKKSTKRCYVEGGPSAGHSTFQLLVE